MHHKNDLGLAAGGLSTSHPVSPGGDGPFLEEDMKEKDHPRSVSHQRHLKLLEKSGGYRCWYCGKLLNASIHCVDHVIPKHEGGRSTLVNMVYACGTCNAMKGKRSIEWFRCYMTHQRLGIPLFSPEQIEFLGTIIDDIRKLFPKEMLRFHGEML